jgi:hypothetical protein
MAEFDQPSAPTKVGELSGQLADRKHNRNRKRVRRPQLRRLRAEQVSQLIDDYVADASPTPTASTAQR